MARPSKRARISSREWHALHVVNAWQERIPSRASLKALARKGLIEEGPYPYPRPYHLTVTGQMFYCNAMLDSYIGKPVDDLIYPSKAEVAHAVQIEIEHRQEMERFTRRAPGMGPFRREYASVELTGGVTIRVPVEDVYWDLEDAELSPLQAIEKRIRGET